MNDNERNRRTILTGSVLLFLLFMSIYILTMSGRPYSVDGMAMFQQAKTLLFQQTFRFSPPFNWDPIQLEYIYWAEGLSIVYILPLALFGYLLYPGHPAFRSIPSRQEALLNDPSYPYCSITNNLLTALTASILFAVAVKLGIQRRIAVVISIVYAIGSPALAFQKQDYAQPLAAFLIVLSILLFYNNLLAKKLSVRSINLILLGCSLGFLVMTRSEMLLLVIPAFTILVFSESRRMQFNEFIKIAFAFLIPLSLLTALHAGVNFIKSGSALGMQGSEINLPENWNNLIIPLLGLLFSPGRGLFIFFPLAIYAFNGLWNLTQAHGKWAFLFGYIIGLHILFYTGWYIWWGGLSWGPRFLVPILPILTLLAFWPNAQSRTPSKIYKYLSIGVKLLVISIGFLMTLSGTLLFWDVIQSRHMPPSKWSYLRQGTWFFKPETNILWTNWHDLTKPSNYDLLILSPAIHQSRFFTYGFILAFITFCITAYILWNWLKRTDIPDQHLSMSAR